MIRTQIQLPEAEYEALKELAHREKRSMADCVREAVAVYTTQKRNRTMDVSSIAGRFKPRPMDDLKSHDRQLAEAILQSKRP